MLTAQVCSIMPGRSLPSYALFFSIHLNVQYFLLDTILRMHVCVSVNVCHVCASAQADLNRASNPPKLEGHVAMSHLTWVLGLNSGPLANQEVLLSSEPAQEV